MNEKMYAELVEQLTISFKEFAKKYGAKILEECNKILSNAPEILAEAWGLEEKNVDTFSLEDCISWAKNNISPEYSSAVVLKQENSPEFSFGERKRRLDIHVYFMDRQNNPVLDGSKPHLLVHCDGLDSSLSEGFGKKDMLVLK